MWRVCLFGGLRVAGPTEEIAHFPTRRAAMILVRVALSSRKQVSRDELADLLWPDEFLDTTRPRLRQELSRLKAALGSASEILRIDRTWVGLDITVAETDLDAVRSAILSGNADRIAAARDLASGPLLPEWNETWLLGEQEAASELLAKLRDQKRTDPPRESPFSWPKAPPTDLTVGRKDERQYLHQALQLDGFARLVTILGEGGIGKTHLARTTSASLSEIYAGRVGFFALEASVDATLHRDLLKKLGIEGNVPLSEAVGSAPCLIILDNIEQCLEAAREIVGELLELPECRVLVTSRAPLDRSEEHRLRLNPLGLPIGFMDRERLSECEASALFLGIGRRYRPDLRIEESDVPIWRLLMQRLEGVPLAIEFAAAQLDRFSVQDVLRNLEASYTSLICGSYNRSPRQASLETAFEWSWRLLNPMDQKALATLATYPAGVRADEVSAILGESGEAQLRRFLAHSLVRIEADRNKAPRVLMRQSTREFALSRVPAEDSRPMCQAFGAHVAKTIYEVSRRMTGPNQDLAFRRAGDESPNVRAALLSDCTRPEDKARLMAAMWRYGTARGESAEWHELYERVLGDLDCPASTELGEAWFGFAILARVSGQWNDQRPVYHRAMEIFAECGSERGQAWCEGNLVLHLAVTRRFREALRTAETVIARCTDDPWNHLMARSDQAMLLAILGQSDAAIPKMEGIFRERMAMSEPGEIAKANLELAVVLYHAGRESDALALMAPGIQLARDSGIQDFVLQNLLARAEFGLAVEGEVPDEVLAEGEMIAQRIGDRHSVTSLRIVRAFTESSPEQLADIIDECLRTGFVQEILTALLWLSSRGSAEAPQLAVDVAEATEQEIPHRYQRFLAGLVPKTEGWETRLAIFSSRVRRMSQV
jgi:hypothetical protein